MTEHNQNKPVIYKSHISAQDCVLMLYFTKSKGLLGISV